MKKWITILGIVVSLVILLLYQSEGRKLSHKEGDESPRVRLEK